MPPTTLNDLAELIKGSKAELSQKIDDKIDELSKRFEAKILAAYKDTKCEVDIVLQIANPS